MANRIHFIPWKFSKNLEDAWNLGWWSFGAVLKGKLVYVVNYKGQERDKLAHMTDGTVYVHGHGAAGDPSISNVGHDIKFAKYVNLSAAFGPEEENLQASEVADRLAESGLQTTFRGKIKCWSCRSGESRTGRPCFASAFAQEMRKKGYMACSYYGYIGELDPFYKFVSGGFHRHTDIGGTIERASAHRTRVPYYGIVEDVSSDKMTFVVRYETKKPEDGKKFKGGELGKAVLGDETTRRNLRKNKAGRIESLFDKVVKVDRPLNLAIGERVDITVGEGSDQTEDSKEDADSSIELAKLVV